MTAAPPLSIVDHFIFEKMKIALDRISRAALKASIIPPNLMISF